MFRIRISIRELLCFMFLFSVLVFPAVGVASFGIYSIDLAFPFVVMYVLFVRREYDSGTVLKIMIFWVLLIPVVLATFINNLPFSVLAHFVRYIEYSFFLLFLIALKRSTLIACFIFANIFIICIAIFQYAGVYLFLSDVEKANFTYNQNDLRIISIFQHPNIFAIYLTSAIAVFIKEFNVSPVLLGYIILNLVALFLTNSRGVMLITFFSVVFYLVYKYNFLGMLLTGILFLILIMLIQVLGVEYLSEKLRLKEDITSDNSVLLRLSLWWSAITISFNNYLLPNGFISFKYLTDVYVWSDFGHGVEEYKTHANSFLLEHLVNEGFVFVFYVYWLLVRSLKGLFKEPSLFIFGVTILGSSIYDDLLHDPIIIVNILVIVKILSSSRTESYGTCDKDLIHEPGVRI